MVTVLVGLILTAAATAISWDQLRASERADTLRSVEVHAVGLQAQMDSYAGVLYGLRGAVVSDQDLDRASFTTAVRASGALTRLEGVQSLQLTALVPLEGARRFEAEASADPLIDGQLPPPVQIHPPLAQPVSNVVAFVEPLEQNPHALGLNLSALPTRDQSIERARDNGRLVTTPPLDLVLPGGEEKGFVQFLPVYTTAEVPLTTQERRDYFRGVLVGVFTAEGVVALAGVGVPDFDIAIYDRGPLGGQTDGGQVESEPLVESVAGLDIEQAFGSADISVGDRMWTVYYVGEGLHAVPLGPWLAALGGVLATGLLALYVWSSGRSRRQVARFIEQLSASEQRFQEMSLSDSLTGLANRRSLMSQMRNLAELSQRTGNAMVVLFLDIDGFKSVNDLYGHKAGDQLLIDMARRLSGAVRQSDLVGRLAGDEFCVCGLVTGEEAADQVARRVQRALSRSYRIHGQDVTVASSIGGTLVRHQDVDIEAMLDAADHAMYESKARGRGEIVWFDEELSRQRLEENTIIAWLHEAVDDDRFALAYQPVVNTARGRVTQVEALLRLTPQGESAPVFPGRFLAIAERTHLIRPLGRKVIERAISDRAEWQRSHPDSDLVLALNISARQANDPATEEAIRLCLGESDLPPELLAVELTETSVFGSEVETQAFLASMRQLGVGLSIDDYGVGYSNLSALSGLGADTLKIDRSLVLGIEKSRSAREILVSVVQVAPHLDLSIVVEGVETAGQYRTLRELGLELMQGFGLSRPCGTLAEAAEVTMPHGW